MGSRGGVALGYSWVGLGWREGMISERKERKEGMKHHGKKFKLAVYARHLICQARQPVQKFFSNFQKLVCARKSIVFTLSI